MKTLISLGDIGDLWRKFQFKGIQVLGRLAASQKKKVAGTWDFTELPPSNWWNIPAVRARWEQKITRGEYANYVELIHQKFLKGRGSLQMVSPGCGTGSHERLFASFPEIDSILAFDLSEKSIEKARQDDFSKIDYKVKDFYAWMDEAGQCDLLFFYSSLHHFGNLDTLIPKLKNKLNPDGLIIIHEYVGPDRMMWTRDQRNEVNRLLKTLPESYRQFAQGKGIKKRTYRPGLWRTLLTDPSESIEPAKIVPLMQEHYTPLYEQGFGGNILHLLFKDIAQHFRDESEQSKKLLHTLFDAEDDFLKTHASDFHFGIYQKRETNGSQGDSNHQQVLY